ncbi:CDP-glycerol glycerophosphotransferase family protein [Homoserinibacter sp. GY 40078]|uniref:CDP-glycerol glycerophosphotransferase family protein n=1 Tax=Homoserinibacter sp. GY 40078 TaxID=2603275 RepID=UPI00210697BD|nr:CDP-glycerol glycerophosphotransferase family protein [Homoserinibacter sp. GY 40078]
MSATFTFGAGNARKLLRLPLYALGALAALLVPRSSRLWVFGSGIGLGEGALPLYLRATELLGDETRMVWLASSEAECADARGRGMDAVLKHSARGFWATLRARVVVVTHGFGDANRYATSRAFVVQLWHGIPLKKLHLDSPATLRIRGVPDHRLVRALLRRAYRFAGRGISLFPVASELVAPRIVSAFGVRPDRVVAVGDIRDDALLDSGKGIDPDAQRAAARARLADAVGPLEEDSRVILYAPTWRDGAPDPGVPTSDDWALIARWLDARDAVLLVRAHPLGIGDYAGGTAASDRIRLLGGDRIVDVTPVLPGIDALVTDYSSIAYDYALTGGPVIFLAPDVERYARARGLYENYRTFSDDRYVTRWPHVLEHLDAGAESSLGRRIARHSRWLREEHIDYPEGHAADRVLREILERTGHGARLPAAVDAPMSRARVVEAQFDEAHDAPVLRLAIEDPVREVTSVRLEGARARVDAAADATTRIEVQLPLLGERWGTPGLALPSGSYRVRLEGEVPTSRLEVAGALPAKLTHPLFHAELVRHAGGLVLHVSAPLADDERGPRAQKRLERAYRRGTPEPERAVFLESFYGQSASCNPAGIAQMLRRMHPDVTRYWSVADGSVAVPEGDVRLVEGSREWWRVRGSARVLIVNDWLRKRYRRRPHQHVLQTWHGTMLKRLALDRAGVGLRTRIAVRRESARWDALLTQNSYASRIFASAYAFARPTWDEGYPRNDRLVSESDASSVRRTLGIPADARVVLYAPTWRDDRTEMVDYLDLTSFAADLGDDHVLLVRGHSRTLRYGRDLEAERLIDVTSYPNVAELLQIADVLVTDYSSVMFDFAATGRPIIFFTPDLVHYSSDLRGFYFDLLAEAPGPVVRTREELADAIADVELIRERYRAEAARWRERFTPLDDGSAGMRVVRRMTDAGWL